LAEYNIRVATREDMGAIRSLIHFVHINPMDLDWRHFLVAVSADDGLLGCGQIKRHTDGSRELASIAVNEIARGRGIARSVIEALLAREETRPLYLMCRARLESLYNKFGFHAVNVEDMPPYFQRIGKVEKLFNSKLPREDRLLVMRLD
jgi:amino-acid N-acetyltransferase